MVRRLLLSLVACGLVAGGAFAQAEDAALRKEVQAIYTQFDSLVGKGDIKGIMSLLHPTFKSVDPDGKVKTYTQTRLEMESVKEMFKGAKSTIKVENVYRDGEEIAAWITMKVTFQVPDGIGKKWKTESFTGKFVETFKRFDGRLMFIRSQMLP